MDSARSPSLTYPVDSRLPFYHVATTRRRSFSYHWLTVLWQPATLYSRFSRSVPFAGLGNRKNVVSSRRHVDDSLAGKTWFVVWCLGRLFSIGCYAIMSLLARFAEMWLICNYNWSSNFVLVIFSIIVYSERYIESRAMSQWRSVYIHWATFWQQATGCLNLNAPLCRWRKKEKRYPHFALLSEPFS